ncbi:MAG: hypothetical protein ABI867_08930 [Kofleriaceae bacterium]
MAITIGLLAVLTTGCATRRQSLKWTAGGIAMSLSGMLLIHSTSGDDDPSSVVVLGSLGLVVGGGLVAVFSGLNAISDYRDPVPDVPPPPPPRAPFASKQRDEARARAWSLTKAAASAARAQDCSLAITADAEVLALDVEFHATVFMRDVAIARCLGDARSPR